MEIYNGNNSIDIKGDMRLLTTRQINMIMYVLDSNVVKLFYIVKSDFVAYWVDNW